MLRQRRFRFYAGAIFAVLCIYNTGWPIAAVRADKPGEETALPDNEKWTAQAWDCFNKKNFAGAIAAANLVTSHFSKLAAGQQADLTARIKKKQIPDPPVGAVSDKVKAQIYTNGVLNDVGTCYFITGKSYEALLATSQANKAPKAKIHSLSANAKAAFKACLTLPSARCWDPSGWFWSTSDGAKLELENFK